MSTLIVNNFQGGCRNCGYGSKETWTNNRCSFCFVINAGEDERRMRKGFESTISKNPRDRHAHLVYADWAEENNYPEEAALRREYGMRLTNPSGSPDKAHRRALALSRKAHTESIKVDNIPLHTGSYLNPRWSRGVARSLVEQSGMSRVIFPAPAPHNSISRRHEILASNYEEHGHDAAASAHRQASLSHLIAHETEWPQEAQEAAYRAGETSLLAHNAGRGNGYLDGEDNLALQSAIRAEQSQSLLRHHLEAIRHHTDALAVGGPEDHRYAIQDHRRAIRIKRRVQ